MYSVYQHWDPLKVCIVGKSYPPEFYNFITNSRVRSVMERIAQETEEDYQKLIKLLESFGITVLRPNVGDTIDRFYINGQILLPPMTPRDYSIMLGKEFYFKPIKNGISACQDRWNEWAGSGWPQFPPKTIKEYLTLPKSIRDELYNDFDIQMIDPLIPFDFNIYKKADQFVWKSVLDHVEKIGNNIYNHVPSGLETINSSNITRVGKDIYVGTDFPGQDISEKLKALNNRYPEFRYYGIDTGGHSDSTFCPVVPGLIVSLEDIPTYKDTFPEWEVVYLPGQSWDKVAPFLKLKEKNRGKWWVPGEELNDEFTEFVESWLSHWIGYVEETVFDVNMLVIDEKNVVCNNYNKQVFDAFDRYGITPHVINFRHRYFWDGGLHCITSDLHREGVMKDYFPKRG